MANEQILEKSVRIDVVTNSKQQVCKRNILPNPFSAKKHASESAAHRKMGQHGVVHDFGVTRLTNMGKQIGQARELRRFLPNCSRKESGIHWIRSITIYTMLQVVTGKKTQPNT